MQKLKLIEVKFIDMFHFQMIQGKYQDMEQLEYQNRETYVYANISNFDSTMEESEVRFYAHSFDELYCAEDYEIYGFGSCVNDIKEELLNSKEYKEWKGKRNE